MKSKGVNWMNEVYHDQMAGFALAGLVATFVSKGRTGLPEIEPMQAKALAQLVYQIADACLEVRNETKGDKD